MTEAAQQTISSSIFGEFKIEAESIYKFKDGIPGLESVEDYAMVAIEQYVPIIWMVSLDGKYHFPLVNFELIAFADLDTISQKIFYPQIKNLQNGNNTLVYVILRLDEKEKLVNLKAPIFLNSETKTGKQLILEG